MIRLHFHEGAEAEEETRAEAIEQPWRPYLVLQPIFKRGRQWEAGEIIMLEPGTAAGFLADEVIKECTASPEE